MTDLGSTGNVVRIKGKKYEFSKRQRFYVHQDNGADVLGVAHLDSVQGQRWCRFYHSQRLGPIVASPTLDDRLGAYVIGHLLPAAGIKVDWLFTVGEESCDSTAKDFECDKEYNWTFSFDRRGTDVVMYDYETPENRERIEELGAQVGIGSYSDICELEHLGVAGFNFGVGYHDYHDTNAYAPLAETFLNVGRFMSFYQRHATERIEHYGRPQWWDSEEIDEECHACGAWALMKCVNGSFCDNCGQWLDTDRPRLHTLSDAEWRKYREGAS